MLTFDVKNSTALVTGANRGIGRAYVEALVAAGAKKVYATARKAESLADLAAAHPGKVEVFALDITSPVQITAAAEQAGDVNLLINNAGVASGGPVVAAKDLSGLEQDFRVNVVGTTAMTRAFAPVLKANGGGAVVVLNSIASLVNFTILGGYSASKAALHSVTQNLRVELGKQGTLVTGVYPGPIDTEMAEPLEMPKEQPSAVAEATIAGLAAGDEEVFPDAMAREMAESIKADWKAVEKNVAQMAA
jgi:NAD(P)-dependent dehydrogenase (short-subunit alcohol dehydrogenase family)